MLICQIFVLECDRGSASGIQVCCVCRNTVLNGGEWLEDLDVTVITHV